MVRMFALSITKAIGRGRTETQNKMGLDMYLNKRTYIGANYEHRNVKATVSIEADGKEIKINPKRISSIEERIGYWRKANAIHQWFVSKCQGGEDDCRDAYVSKENLLELLEECKKIKEAPDKAAQSMPTTAGFFFGGIDYDEWYFKQIDYTIKLIEDIIEEEGGADKKYWGGEYYYTSSW
jgi:hypothetical protein